MGLRGVMGSLSRVPVFKQIVDWGKTLSDVYGAFDVDPTYHPQRNEDRLREAQRVARLGNRVPGGSEKKPEDANPTSGTPSS